MIDYLLATYSLNYYAIPLFFVAFVALGVGTVTLLRNRFSVLHGTFLVFTGVVSAWSISLIFLLSSPTTSHGQFWAELLLLFICFIPPFLYLFVTLMNEIVYRERYYLTVSFVGAAMIGYLIFFTSLISDGVHEYDWGFYPRPGEGHLLYLLFFLFCIGKVVHVFYREIRERDEGSIGVQRNRSLLIGTIVGYVASVDFLPFYGVSVVPFGYVFILTGITIYAVTISEYRLSGLTDDRIASNIFMTIDEAVLVTDEDGQVQLANESARDLLALETSEFDGVNFNRFLADDELEEVIGPMANLDEADGSRECQLVDAEGNRYYVRLKVSTIGTGSGSSTGPGWFVLAAQDTTQLKETRSKLDAARYKNIVTGLPNEKRYRKELEEGKVPEECAGAVYVIVKDFRSIKTNLDDSKAFDYLLNTIASRLQALLPEETLYQVDENEYFIPVDQEGFDEQLRDKKDPLSAPINLGDETVHINYSIGIVEDRPSEKAYRLSQSTAVNQAVERPGTVIARYSRDVSEEHERYFDVKHDLPDAIERGQVKVFFQPQMLDGTVRGAEALIRWNHPEHGFITPPRIVRAAVEMNYEDRLLHHVLGQATNLVREWSDGGVLSVNIAPRQLEHKNRLLNMIRENVDESGVTPDRFEVELTEQAAVRDLETSREMLGDLRDMGVGVSIDDFGTGYSSFRSLIELPLDNLKIDKSFVLNLNENTKNKRIIETARDMARTLDLDVIAEGVETTEHRDYLRGLDIGIMQGFHWSEALPHGEFLEFARAT